MDIDLSCFDFGPVVFLKVSSEGLSQLLWEREHVTKDVHERPVVAMVTPDLHEDQPLCNHLEVEHVTPSTVNCAQSTAAWRILY